ncbi:hypothetical protein ACI3PL_28985, partial [Lacticaseibacillus paracasei]
YFRRDFVSFEKILNSIRLYDPLFVDFCSLLKRQLLEGSVTFEEWKILLGKAEQKRTHLIVHRKIYTELVTKSIQQGSLNVA